MKTRTSDRSAHSDPGGSPIYEPVAVRSTLAAIVIVAVLYCWHFTRLLPSALAETVSCVAIMVLVGLGWAGIHGSPGFFLRPKAHPLREISRLAFYVIAAWLCLHFTCTVPLGVDVYLTGFLVLLGLWWAGTIGALGSLLSREAHPLRVLSLLTFYVMAALLAIWWSR